MASQSTTTDPPAEQAPAPEPGAPAQPATEAPAPFVGEYLDEVPRTYLFPGAAPQTAVRGDVCALPQDPGDGRWKASKAKVTRPPDSDPDQIAKTSAARAEARRKANEQAAAAAKGGE